MLLGEVRHRVDRVEVAGVHLAGARDHQGGHPAERSELAVERVEVQPARRIAGELVRPPASEAEHRQHLRVARVQVPRREHRHRGKAGEPLLVHVGAVPKRPPPPRGRERDEVRHRGSGREDPAPTRREPEQVEEPPDRDGLELRGERRAGPVAVVLVHERGEPVGAEGRRGDASGHEVEEAWARRCDQTGPAIEELRQGRSGAAPRPGQVAADRLGDLVRAGSAHWRVVHVGQVPLGFGHHEPKDLRELVPVRACRPLHGG